MENDSSHEQVAYAQGVDTATAALRDDTSPASRRVKDEVDDALELAQQQALILGTVAGLLSSLVESHPSLAKWQTANQRLREDLVSQFEASEPADALVEAVWAHARAVSKAIASACARQVLPETIRSTATWKVVAQRHAAADDGGW